MLAARPDLAAESLVMCWSDKGWPTVRRRAMPGEVSGMPLGVPLPPSAGKKRLCFLLQGDGIARVARPPSLQVAYGMAPAAWRPTLDRLGVLAARHSVQARIFGSFAWHALTGLDYLTDRSDLDLLLDINGDTDLDRLTADIALIEAGAPMRLDGELMREDGAAVNWREFHAGAAEVLIKRIDGVALVDRRQFMSAGAMS